MSLARKLSWLLIFVLACTKEGDFPELTSGRLDRLEQFGSGLVTPRNIDIWLPDGYSSEEEYAVIYMHDGQMLFDANTTWNKQAWDVDDMVAKLLLDEKMKPCIVVGIWNISDERDLDYIPAKPIKSIDGQKLDSAEAAIVNLDLRSDNYLRFIVTELKPYIDKNYATYQDTENTFLLGSSKGGLISMYGLAEYPDVFGGAACLSTHWTGSFTENKPIPEAFRDYLKRKRSVLQGKKLYFDRGTETLDAIYPYGQNIIDEVFIADSSSGIKYRSLVFEGKAHDEVSWAERLDIPLIFLLGK